MTEVKPAVGRGLPPRAPAYASFHVSSSEPPVGAGLAVSFLPRLLLVMWNRAQPFLTLFPSNHPLTPLGALRLVHRKEKLYWVRQVKNNFHSCSAERFQAQNHWWLGSLEVNHHSGPRWSSGLESTCQSGHMGQPQVLSPALEPGLCNKEKVLRVETLALAAREVPCSCNWRKTAHNGSQQIIFKSCHQMREETREQIPLLGLLGLLGAKVRETRGLPPSCPPPHCVFLSL